MHRADVRKTHSHRGCRPNVGLLVVIVVSSFICGVAWAFDRDKSDVVTLRRGDLIYGDIISLRYGILTVATDNMGTLSIEWPAVRSISSKFAFAVERRGGKNFYGVIDTTKEGTALVVSTGDSATTIPIGEVERISQYSPSFWSRINGNLAVGFSYTKSSEISVGSVNFNSNYRSTAIDASLTFSSNTTKSPSSGETDRNVLGSQVLFLRQSRNFWGLVGSVERDQALGIDARVVGGAVLGRRLLQASYSEVTGAVGVVATQEWYTGDSQGHTSAEGLLGVDWKVFRFIEPKTTLDLSAALFPSLTDSGRYRGTANLSLTHKFPHDVTVGLTGYWTYDSHPPQGAIEKSDYGLTFNLGYSFGQ